MRATVGDIPRLVRLDGFKNGFLCWWEEWPARHRRFWMLLLFEPGQGWLRWGTDQHIAYTYIDEGLRAPEPYQVAPPLRRFAWGLWSFILCPYSMLVGYKHDGTRYRLSWEEAQPSFSYFGMFKDPDRYQELWHISRKDRAFLKRQRASR